jgi:hypothetical protein
MKQKSGWWCGVVCCVFLACVVEDGEGSHGVNGTSGKQSTVEEGELLIVEILADPQGVDTGKEYIEIHNPTDMALSLEGLELFVIPTTSSKEKRFALPSREMPPGAYWTFGDVPPGNLPAHIDIGYERALGALPNTQATVGLRKTGGDLIDSMHYSSSKAGRSLSRHCLHMASQQCTNENAVWCFAEADTLYDGENHGSPQKPNAACKKDADDDPTNNLPPGTCLEGGVLRDIRVPQPGQLILNELMISPGAGLIEAESEWVELWALDEVDLNGLELRTRSRSQKINSANCLPVEADAYVLLARSTAPEVNGCLEEVDGLLTLPLPNSSPESNRQSLTLYAGEEILDSVTYTTAPKARSYQRDPDTQNWCYLPTNSPLVYDTCREGGGNRGTPKDNNVPCP